MTAKPVTARSRRLCGHIADRLQLRSGALVAVIAVGPLITAGLTIAAAGTTVSEGRTSTRPLAPAQSTPPTPASVAHLPLALHGSLNLAIQTAAAARTATARAAATQTARATGTARLTPSPSPTPPGGTLATPSATPSGGSTEPPPSATPTAIATASPSPTPPPSLTPTATGPTPTPTASLTPSITPTPRKDPGGERLIPAAALRPGDNSVTYDTAARVYRLSHRGDTVATYELDLRHPDNTRGRLSLRETTSGRFPIAGAGLFYRQADGNLVEPRLFSLVGTVDTVEHAPLPTGDGVALTVRETLEGQPHSKRYTLRLVGAAIELLAESLDAGGVAAGAAGYAGFSAGQVEGSSDFVSVRLPYMDAVPVTMLDHRWFASTLVDYPRSQATALLVRGPEAGADAFINEVAPIYEPDAAGRIRPIDEAVWVTLSPKVADTFAVPDQPPSPHRAALAGLVHVTLAGGAPDVSFADEAAYVESLAGWRVTDVLVHKPDWQPDQAQRPAQGPPDPAAGGMDGFARLIAAAGGQLAPSLAYTLTVTGCPGAANPLYRPADRVLGADGAPKSVGAGACPEPGGGESRAFLLAPDAARRLAGEAAGDLARWGARAVDLDVLPARNPAFAWPGAPDNVLDQAAAPAHPATIGAAIGAIKRLFAELQAGIGPVFGPGAFGAWETGYDSFYAGYVDGLARSLSNGSIDAPAGASYLVVPDYELAVVRPRMVGYGMGDYRRFFAERAEDEPGEVRPLTEDELDEWQATVLAYGHAGAWMARGAPAGDSTAPDFLTPAEQVKTYFIMHTLQARYLDAPLVSIGYIGADGVEHDLDWALTHDFNLAGPRLHLVFGGGTGGGGTAGGGLELWLNHSPDLWTVTVGSTYSLPQHGWLARGDGGLLGYSALIEGRRADYLQAPEVTLMDGRGRLTDFGGLSARDLVVRFPDGWRLEEQADGGLVWLGPGGVLGSTGANFDLANPAQPDATTAEVEVQRDVAYYAGPDADPARQQLDFYLPAGQARFPMVLFVHGGGWTSGSRRNHANVGRALAARGIGVAAVDYRLTDGGPASVAHPAHVTDLARAVGFVRAAMIVRGIPPGEIFLMGQGAGAHLAALAATNPRFLGQVGLSPGEVRGVVGLSGTYALDPGSRAYANVFGLDPALRLDASPLDHVSRDDPASLLLYADDDLPRRDAEAEALAAALRRVGVQAAAEVAAGRDFETLLAAIGRPGDPTTDRIEAFIRGLSGLEPAGPPATPAPTEAPPPTPPPALPPPQPAEGPGGSARLFAAATVQEIRDTAGTPLAWVLAPDALALPERLPVVIFLGDTPGQEIGDYGAWLDHIARGGAIVLVPVLPEADRAPPAGWTTRAAAALRPAFDALDHEAAARLPAPPDRDRVAYVGHGQGATGAASLAGAWFEARLPAPRAVFLVMPQDRAGLLATRALARIPRDTQTLLVAADRGSSYDDPAEILLWDSSVHVPSAWRNRLVVASDYHGSPALIADYHLPRTGGPNGWLDALDWYGPWKWLDGLLACAFSGLDCAYAFGGTPRQTSLGAWSDGQPVRPARLAPNPNRPRSSAVYLPAAVRDYRPPRR